MLEVGYSESPSEKAGFISPVESYKSCYDMVLLGQGVLEATMENAVFATVTN